MATKVIQMMEKTSSGYDTLIPIGGGIVLRVTSSSGTTVSCSFNGATQSHTFTEDGSYDFYGSGYGNYSFTMVNDTGSNTYTQVVSESKIYDIYLFGQSSVLNDNSWSVISKISSIGIGSNIWAIGDIKMIQINGTITNSTFNKAYGVFIASFSHNASVEGSGILFHGFKNNLTEKRDICLYANFQMNTSGITTGGWRDCYMRKTIIPQFKNAIPQELKNVVKTSTIYSHNAIGGSSNNSASNVTATQDDFYLLAEFDIFGTRTYANSYEQSYQVQVEYYKLGNSKVKYQSTNESSAGSWWERSVGCSGSNTNGFCSVGSNGNAGSNGANSSRGFAVAFRV